MSCVSIVASFFIFILDCPSGFSNVYHLLSVLLQFGGSDYPFGLFVCLFVWWCLAPLPTIVQLYCDGQFYWWGNQRIPREPSTCRQSPLKNYSFGIFKLCSINISRLIYSWWHSTIPSIFIVKSSMKPWQKEAISEMGVTSVIKWRVERLMVSNYCQF